MEAKSTEISDCADRLTLLTTLYGRPEFTLRHLLYLEAVRCPFKIFFADGSLDDQNRTIIENNRHRCPHVQYVYHRYPPDKDWLDYFRKNIDAFNRITTPYVCWYDTDDFHVMHTMAQCVAFLEGDTQHQYSGCMGRQWWFTTRKHQAFARINSGGRTRCDERYELSDPAARLLGRLPDDTWIHCVARTEHLKALFQVGLDCQIQTNVVNNYLEQCYLLACGKVKWLPGPFIYKQIGTCTWSNEFILESFFKCHAESSLRQLMHIIAGKICADPAQTTAMEAQLLDDYIQFNNPRTLYQFLWRQFFFGTAFWKRFVSFYSRFNAWRRFPQTVQSILLNRDPIFATIRKILRNKPV